LRILLIGSNGQIGWELQRTLPDLGELIALGRAELDLTVLDEISAAVRDIKPGLIVNAAAYTAVDRAEEEPELAMTVNGVAPGVMAEEAGRIGAVLVHYSTDYVFDGTKGAPYLEDDSPNPINVYGQTKLAGERAIQETKAPHIIFRTSWVYGLRGKNFLRKILRLAREKEELGIVDDQVGTPNWCRTVAAATVAILKKDFAFIRMKGGLGGIYNLSSSGSTTWFGFARAILDGDPLKEEHICRRVEPIKTCQYPTPARRPLYSVLDNSKIQRTFGVRLGPWEEELQEVFRTAQEAGESG